LLDAFSHEGSEGRKLYVDLAEAEGQAIREYGYEATARLMQSVFRMLTPQPQQQQEGKQLLPQLQQEHSDQADEQALQALEIESANTWRVNVLIAHNMKQMELSQAQISMLTSRLGSLLDGEEVDLWLRTDPAAAAVKAKGDASRQANEAKLAKAAGGGSPDTGMGSDNAAGSHGAKRSASDALLDTADQERNVRRKGQQPRGHQPLSMQAAAV